MGKKLITLLVPCIGEQYDILIPEDLVIATLIGLITKATSNLSNGRYVSSGKELLCCVEDGRILNPELTLADYRICNGDRLMIC